MEEWRADRSRPTRDGRAAFFFDLSCPFSYLAAERLERALGDVDWIPAAGVILRRAVHHADVERLRRDAEWRALELRLPLVWPDRFPAACWSAMAAATRAAEEGSCARFALAASRLAFCGGFDLDDPETLAEAAAAAGIHPEHCLAAAQDPRRHAELDATARGLLARGVRELPAIRVGNRWFAGESALDEAAALVRLLAARGQPLAPTA